MAVYVFSRAKLADVVSNANLFLRTFQLLSSLRFGIDLEFGIENKEVAKTALASNVIGFLSSSPTNPNRKRKRRPKTHFDPLHGFRMLAGFPRIKSYFDLNIIVRNHRNDFEEFGGTQFNFARVFVHTGYY